MSQYVEKKVKERQVQQGEDWFSAHIVSVTIKILCIQFLFMHFLMLYIIFVEIQLCTSFFFKALYVLTDLMIAP